MIRKTTCLSLLLACFFAFTSLANAADLNLLFMGDNGHHRPGDRFVELAPALAKRGIELKYTDRMDDLNSETLAKFDGLVLYANIDRIEDAQAKAVLDYVAAGKGFIPLHCATSADVCCGRLSDDVDWLGTLLRNQQACPSSGGSGHPARRCMFAIYPPGISPAFRFYGNPCRQRPL